MALLSATQGSPERVWSLTQVLNAHGGKTTSRNLSAWMNPCFTGVDAGNDQSMALSQTLDAARGLGIIRSAGTGDGEVELIVDIPEKFAEFPKLIHSLLLGSQSEDADYRLFEVFACVVMLSQKKGNTLWTRSKAEEFADQINKALVEAGDNDAEKSMNPTKLPPWRRWMTFLGLQIQILKGEYVPYTTAALEREVINNLPKGQEISAKDLLSEISKKMPYLDAGEIHEKVCKRSGFEADASVCSPILSAALIEMEDDKKIKITAVGDTAGYVSLVLPSTGNKRSFSLIQVSDNG